MNKSKFWKSKHLTYLLTAVFTAVLILATSIQTYAENPSAAYIHHIEGSVLLVQDGNENEKPSAKLGDQIRGNRTLTVPGERRGWANLGFVFESSVVSDNGGLLVQAGPHADKSTWSFPCTIQGGFRIAWRRGNNRGCEEGVRVQASKGLTNLSLNQENYTVQAVKNVLKAQASEEVTVAPPSSESSLIQAYESDTGIKVETIEGDILVKSTQNPQGRLIPEGKRYSYPQDTIEDIDRDAIINSPEMQDFLNPDNWSSPNIPQRVVDEVANQLGQHRTALGLPTKEPEQIAAQPPQSQLKGELVTGTSYGDPHLITFDAFRYSFQTVGEFILTKSTSGDFEVQARQSKVPGRDVSLNTATAMKVGNDRVAFYAKSFPKSDTSTPLYINGQPTLVEGNSLSLPSGGSILQQGQSNYLVEWPTGEQVAISMLSNGFMNISPAVPSSSKGNYTGLLGNFDDDPSNDLRSQNGNVLPSQSTYGQISDTISSIISIPGASVINKVESAVFEQLYKEFGNSWRVDQTKSLFDYAPGQTTETFTDLNFPSTYKTLEMLSSNQIQAAEAACLEAGVEANLLEGCIFDVGFTGDTSFAQSAANALNLIDQFLPGGIPRPSIGVPGLPF